MASKYKFIDIGANLTDSMYEGYYNGSKKHDPDLDYVMERSWKHGLRKIMITGGSLEDSRKALEAARKHENLFSTVGCHPTRCSEFEESGNPKDYLSQLLALIKENSEKVVAVGEFGLDYDRLKFCDKDTQKKYFEMQLEALGCATGLPLFLHCRNAAPDLVEILGKYRERLNGGVVHSFDGSLEDAQNIIDLGFYIGLNGCSLKTEENLKVVAELPIERLMIETDCPWCEIRPSHAGSKFIQTKFEDYPSVKKEKWKPGAMVKSRNEPCNIVQVLEVVAAVKKEEPSTVGEIIFRNTSKVFFPNMSD